MEMANLTATALILCVFVASAHGAYYTKTVPFSAPAEKVTKLHFFFHDTLSGRNPSAVKVAQANLTDDARKRSLAPFGSLFAIDDPLTVGPDPTSEKIGNARGLYLSSERDGITLVSYYDFGFTAGEFNGSSISLFSRNPVQETEREVAVVGGRGKFRMARGSAHLKTYSFNMATGDAIVEYDVTVIHY